MHFVQDMERILQVKADLELQVQGLEHHLKSTESENQTLRQQLTQLSITSAIRREQKLARKIPVS